MPKLDAGLNSSLGAELLRSTLMAYLGGPATNLTDLVR
jgi:hypothetical protein